MDTDAALGCSCLGYQSSYVALEIRGGEKNMPLRMEGTSRGSGAARGQPAQRGKDGFFVCCARVGNIAVPVIYEVGEDDGQKRPGAQLWESAGLWAPHYLAACHYGRGLSSEGFGNPRA